MTFRLKKTFTNGSIKDLGDYIMKKQFKEFSKAFVPFLVVGDPNPEDFIDLVKRMIPYVDVLEFGIPFSDPIADGPTIQEANMRAFNAGMNTDRALRLISRVRDLTDKPIVILTYANVLGVENRLINNIRKFKDSGIDGIIIADVPLEESDPYKEVFDEFDMDLIALVTPLTDEERLEKILSIGSGYLYYVSVLGITGARKEIDENAICKLQKIKDQINGRIPLLVGFGISNEIHAKTFIDNGADGVIVGSAIIQIIENNLQDKEAMLEKIETFCKSIKKVVGVH